MGRELLDFMVQGKINRGRHTDHPAGCHSIRTNQCPPPPSPIFYRPDAVPAAKPTVSALKATSIIRIREKTLDFSSTMLPAPSPSVSLVVDFEHTLNDDYFVHSFKLFLPPSRVNCRKHFFAVRVINAWNSLSNEIVSTDRLSLFKSRLKQVDLSKFMVGNRSCS